MQKIITDNIPALVHIYKNSFTKAWGENDFTELLNNPAIEGFLIEDKGFILFQKSADEAEIITIAVHPNARKQGIGKKLVNQLIKQYKSIFLEVNETNQAAINLYKSCGFINIGIRKKYYDNKYDAITMQFIN